MVRRWNAERMNMTSRRLLDWNKIDRVSKNLTNEVARAIQEGEGCIPEADSRVNAASRKVIQVFHKTGETWLGKINAYSEMIKRDTFLWKYEGAEIFNFYADFVLPQYDKELEQLLRERHEGNLSLKTLVKIHKRIESIKGVVLLWS